MKKTALVLSSTVVAAAFSANVMARDTISIVGSSTVYPFATVVAERFGRTTDFNTPKIESTGSGGGLKLFCGGIGVQTPDISNASRRMKVSEYETCLENGVTDIVEVLIGFDGIAVANSVNAQQFELGVKELYLALAKTVPNPDNPSELIENPYRQWSEIDASLPATDIEVIGPPPTSGTRDAFVELAMEGGCEQFDTIANLPKDEFKSVCHTMREDGAFIEAGENDNLIVQKLEANPDALGIFGFSFLEQNTDKVQSSILDGHTANFDSIASGDYGISRPLYFYVKAQHVGTVPGIAEYLAEFTSEQTWGNDGYLADKGMIPLGDEQRAEIGASVIGLEKLILE